MSENQTKKRIAVGCGILAVVAGLAVIIGGYYVYQTVQKVKSDAKNPGPRALEILGAKEFPPGYFPNAAVSIPFVMDSVVLSDQENKGGKPVGFGKGKGFLYSQVLIGEEKNSEELEAFFTGKSDDLSALHKNRINVSFDKENLLVRGVIAMNGMQVRYMTVRDGFSGLEQGVTINQEGDSPAEVTTEGIEAEGLTTLFMFQCPSSKKLRFGIWFSDVKLEPPYDLTGTVGDETMITGFLDHFQLCGTEAPKP